MELVYKLKSTDKGVREDKYEYLDKIMIEELHEFAIDCLNEYGSKKKLEEANKLCKILIDMLVHKRLVDDKSHQSFVDMLLVSAFLHNLFYDEDDWRTLFDARFTLSYIVEEKKINSQVMEAVYQTVEGQLGERTPVSSCIPKPNTPTEMFAYCVWFLKEYNPQV